MCVHVCALHTCISWHWMSSLTASPLCVFLSCLFLKCWVHRRESVCQALCVVPITWAHVSHACVVFTLEQWLHLNLLPFQPAIVTLQLRPGLLVWQWPSRSGWSLAGILFPPRTSSAVAAGGIFRCISVSYRCSLMTFCQLVDHSASRPMINFI